MNTKERLLANLKALAETGALPRSHCGVRLMSLLRPLVSSGVVAERRLGAGRQIIVRDLLAFQSFMKRTFPMDDLAADLPNRVLGVRRFRDTKTYRTNGADILRVRAFSPGTLRKQGLPVDVHGATASHGVFSFRLTPEYTLHGQVAVVENPTVFDLFERLELPPTLVIYGQGRISGRVLGWFCDQGDEEAFSLLHLPDYDPVGLTEFERIRARLGSRAQLHIPEDLDDLFRRFGNPELLGKSRSRRLLVKLRSSKSIEVQTVVRLIDSHNAGLEQEVLIRR
jgi:hypothetical protein